MSETLLNWLNSEIKLSVPITDIPSQFANGYYFGELLSKYKLLPTFNEFRNTMIPLDITRNYGLLQKAFSDLSIQLTEVQKGELLSKKKFKAEMYLFKLKQKISQKLIDFDSIMQRTSGKNQVHELYKNLQFGTYDQQMYKTQKIQLDASKMIRDGLQRTNSTRNNNNNRPYIQSAKLQPIRPNSKFNKTVTSIGKGFASSKYDRNIVNDIINEEQYLSQRHFDRKNQIHHLETSKHSNEISKDKDNMNNWKTQMNFKSAFDKEQQRKENEEAIYYKTATLNGFYQSSQTNTIEIKKFDDNLSKLGLDLKTLDPKLAKNPNKTISTEVFIERIRNQIAEKEKSKRDKEKRQRKIMSANLAYINNNQPLGGNSNSNNNLYLPHNTNPTLTASNFYPCNTTNQNFYKNTTRATTAKPVTATKAKPQLPPINTISENNCVDWNDYVSNDVYDENRFFGELHKLSSGFHATLMKNKLAKKQRDTAVVAPVITQMLELVDECFWYQNINDKELIEVNEWKLLMERFIKGESLQIYHTEEQEEKKEVVDDDNNDYTCLGFMHKDDKEEDKDDKEVTLFARNELLNYLYFCGTYVCDNVQPHNIKLDLLDVMGTDIKILINDASANPIDNEYDNGLSGNNDMNANAKGFGGSNEYEPRTEDLEMLVFPKENTINLILGEIVNEIVDNKYNNEGNNIQQQQQQQQQLPSLTGNENEVIETTTEQQQQQEVQQQQQQLQVDQEQQQIDNNTSQTPFQDIFNSLPIKATFIGNMFSGKRTQGKLLSESFPKLKIYNIDDIIRNILDIQTKIDTPIESHPKFKSLRKPQLEQMRKEKEQLTEQILPYKPLIDRLNKELQQHPIPSTPQPLPPPQPVVQPSGKDKSKSKDKTPSPPPTVPVEKIIPCSDELQIDFLLTTIKLDFPSKTASQLKTDIQSKRERIIRINNEIDKIKEEQIKKPKAKVKEEQYLKEELKKIEMNSYYGFIIINFPKNAEQARLFEYKINAYTQAIESNKSENEIQKEKMLFLCDRELKKSELSRRECALNKLFIFDTPEDEIIRRVQNRKYDPQSGIYYHMTDNPPNDHDKKLKERLLDVTLPTVDDVKNNVKDYLKNYDKIMEFYLNFNFSKENINSIGVSAEINDKLKDIFHTMVDAYELDILPLDIKDEMTTEQNAMNADQQQQQQQTDSNNTSIVKSTTAFKKQSTSFNRKATATTKDHIAVYNTYNYPQLLPSIEKNKQFDFTKIKLQHDTLIQVYNTWQMFTNSYSLCYYKLFSKMAADSSLAEQLTAYQTNFIKFLSKQSPKKDVLLRFKTKYKAFLEQYNSIKLNHIVKDEFNRDLNEVTDQIWALIEHKKNEAIFELTNITNSDFVLNEMKKFYFSIEKMFILETEKLISTLNLLFHFSAVFLSSNNNASPSSIPLSNVRDSNNSVNTFEIQNGVANNLLKNTSSLSLIDEDTLTKKVSYPKITRLYKNCVIVLFKLALFIKQNEKNYFLAKNAGDSTATHKKRRMNFRIGNTDQTALTEMNEEIIKNAIKVEINKYKYRINFLCSYGMKNLHVIFTVSQRIFDTMDEWIIDSVKLQNDAMNDVINHLRKVVEFAKANDMTRITELDDFSKMYKLIDVNTLINEEQEVDITKEKDIEDDNDVVYSDDSFSVAFFGNVVLPHIKEYEIQHNIINKENFIEIFFIKSLLNPECKRFFSLRMQKLNFHHFTAFMEYFVFLSSDICIKEQTDEQQQQQQQQRITEQPQSLILTNAIMTVLLLAPFKVVSESEAMKIKTENESKIYRKFVMNKRTFMDVEMWFEKDKVFNKEMGILYEDEKNVKMFMKDKKFKEILFDINKLNDNEINIDLFIDTITLKTITKAKQPKAIGENVQRYYDLFYN